MFEKVDNRFDYRLYFFQIVDNVKIKVYNKEKKEKSTNGRF